jgi:hypothetical protein
MTRKGVVVLLTGAVIAAMAFGPSAAARGHAKAAKKKAGPVQVAEDPSDDWGAATDPNIQPLGEATGQELIGATIEKVDAETLNFVIQVTGLPPTGGTPEVVRYVWDFMVDGELFEADGKWLNYTRGACDPTSGQCPPPRDPGQQPFLIRTNCGPNATVSNLVACEEVAVVKAIFDTAAGTITIPIPMAAINAKVKSTIVGGANTIGGNISSSPAAFVSSANMPYDSMVMTKTYVVPK